jgi:hypothetical protein
MGITNKEKVNNLITDFIASHFDICATDMENLIFDKKRLIDKINEVYNQQECLLEIDLKTGDCRELPDNFHQEVSDIKKEISIDKNIGEL